MEIVVAVLVVWILLALVAQVGARRQVQVTTQHRPEEVLHLIESRFSFVWKKVRDEGDLNYKPLFAVFRLPTLSVSVQPRGSDGSEVLIWVSDYVTTVGGLVMVHAPTMWIKKMRLASALR